MFRSFTTSDLLAICNSAVSFFYFLDPVDKVWLSCAPTVVSCFSFICSVDYWDKKLLRR